jgi:nitroreductase
MELKAVIESRRAYRALAPTEITKALIEDLAGFASLAPSCFNNQPWRYVFVYEPEALKRMKGALSKGNEWAHDASMIIAVFSRKEDDCVIKDRQLHQFDTGMATALLILRATELGLVAHPIGGYSERKAKEAAGIPDDMQVITLVIIGKHADEVTPSMSEDQKAIEVKRPERYPLERFAFHNVYIPSAKPG